MFSKQEILGFIIVGLKVDLLLPILFKIMSGNSCKAKRSSFRTRQRMYVQLMGNRNC